MLLGIECDGAGKAGGLMRAAANQAHKTVGSVGRSMCCTMEQLTSIKPTLLVLDNNVGYSGIVPF